MSKEVTIPEASTEHPTGRAYDELTDREKKFIDFWFQFQIEAEKAGEPLSDNQAATMAAEGAGYGTGGIARKAGWRLIRSPKIRHMLHNMAGIEVVMAHYKAVKVLIEILDGSAGPGHKLKAAQEVIALNEDLKKVMEVKMTHEAEASGEALDAQLKAALERQGLKVIEGGKLIATIEGEAVEVRPAPGLPGRFEADVQPEASRRHLHSARGAAHILLAQPPGLPRKGRKPKIPLVPNKEAEEVRRQLAELGITPEEAGL